MMRSVLVRNGAMWGELAPGDVIAMPGAPSAAVATAGNLTVTTGQIASGAMVFTGAVGAVAYTYPTGAALDLAFPDMPIGSTIQFTVTNTAAQVATMTTAAGLTLTGLVTINAATRRVYMTKTAAATYTLLHV